MPTNIADGVPLKPGQRVAVFPYDAASGATIGHYGVVVDLVSNSLWDNPNCPDAWCYRVRTAQGDMIVADRDTLALEPKPPSDFQVETSQPVLEISFEKLPDDDNVELRGAYRLSGCPWGRFCFLKQARASATFQLRVPTEHSALQEEILFFGVPTTVCLDRKYVLQAFTEIMGRNVCPSE